MPYPIQYLKANRFKFSGFLGGMLVVSLRGVNFGFWSQLGCSGQNAIKSSREGLNLRSGSIFVSLCK